MLPVFSALREMSLISVAFRLCLALVCGGVIGIERGFKRRPAGFRTHILICLGAAMTTMTSQYLYLCQGYYTDMARLGAQVIAGIGFVGAGTMIVTKRQRVKGLTTAAGLWTTAIIGLCIGGSFYEGAIITTVLILVAELFFSKMEYRILDHTPEVNLYIEYRNRRCLQEILDVYRENRISVLNVEVTRSETDEFHNACAIFTLRLNKNILIEQLLRILSTMESVSLVEEL